jgi:DNA-binding winged helix-turn-helix (wHTH) protein
MEPASEARNLISFGPFNLFAADRLLKKGDEPILLGDHAIEVLIALAERAGEVANPR